MNTLDLSAPQVTALINALYHHSPEAIGVSAAGVHLMVNPAYIELFRYNDAAELVGRPVLDLIAPASRALVTEYIRRRGHPEVPDRYEVTGLRKDGTEFDLDVRVSAYMHKDTASTLVILRDVTAQNEAERALADSREFYRALFEVNTAVKLLIRPATGAIVDANQAASALYGWPVETLRKMRIQDINVYPEPQVRIEMEMARSGGRRYFEFEHRTASGAIKSVEVYSGPVEVRGESLLLSIVHNVTGKKALEEQLRQAQKMEAIGRLAGGIAHDFNNLLMVMMGYGELATYSLPEGSDMRTHVDGMLAAAGRARDLTGQLLAFSRRQVLQPQLLSLNVVIHDIASMLRRTIGPGIELVVVADPRLAPTLADPGQLDQVLMNLAINARDAMPNGGTLTMTTYNREADTAVDARTAPRDLVVLEVADTGQGMDRATMARVFEPFFTTKAPGEGTGLGLSTVYGIVTQSGGRIEVDSELGKGTRFRVLLPVAADDSLRRPSAVATAESPGVGHVLLVDDQDDVRGVIEQMLRHSGFTVETARDADSAQQLFTAATRPFDLLLSDVVMPGRSGVDLAAALTDRRPNLPVLLISGDLQDHRSSTLPPTWVFLQKPFTREALLDRVSEALRPKAAKLRRG